MSRGAANRGTIDIAFVAISQAHQFLHWLPAALRLSREPGVSVTVLASTQEGADFIRTYDPEARLHIKMLRSFGEAKDGLFDPPARLPVLLLNALTFARYPILVTTETTSSWLRRLPGFRSRMIHLKHGAGDREGGYNPKHADYDLTLVNGAKDKQRLIDRGLGNHEDIKVVGYGKFELIRPQQPRLFPNDKPIALYNPHFDADVGTWIKHGEQIVRAMEGIQGWNFVVAPHVKLRGGPATTSSAANVLIDRGSVRSIDTTYTQVANVYIGDVSSQVYEFIRTPRPCIFLNLDRRDWRSDSAYTHWHFGQVIDDVAQLPAALDRAADLQLQFEGLQRERLADSIDESSTPASERQAQAILEFARATNV